MHDQHACRLLDRWFGTFNCSHLLCASLPSNFVSTYLSLSLSLFTLASLNSHEDPALHFYTIFLWFPQYGTCQMLVCFLNSKCKNRCPPSHVCSFTNTHRRSINLLKYTWKYLLICKVEKKLKDLPQTFTSHTQSHIKTGNSVLAWNQKCWSLNGIWCQHYHLLPSSDDSSHKTQGERTLFWAFRIWPQNTQSEVSLLSYNFRVPDTSLLSCQSHHTNVDRKLERDTEMHVTNRSECKCKVTRMQTHFNLFTDEVSEMWAL